MRISFTIGNVTVTGPKFSRVAECVEGGLIRVSPGGLLGLVGVDGDYDPVLNRMRVEVDSIEDKQTVVHEAVHAMNDSVRLRVTTRDDEAAAFVADAWYYQAKTGNRITTSTPRLAVTQEVHAHDIASAFRRTPPSVTEALLDGLRDTITAHETYRNRPDPNYNGL